jgi:hypothetical protein
MLPRMKRRDFLGTVAATSLAGTAFGQGQASKKPGCYVIRHFRLQLGSQGARLSECLSKHYLPAVARAGGGPTLVLEAQVSEHLPLVTVIDAYASPDAAWKMRATLGADTVFQDGMSAWQSGAERPYESESVSLLEATAFAPEFAAPVPTPRAPRVYELRVYQTHTNRELRGLVERFAEAEARILARSGAALPLFGTTVYGQDTPNLTWLMAFDDMAARETSAATFNADPDWIKLRQQSLERYGQVPSYRRLTLYRAASYSKIR